jgi:hypothetical protein
MRIKVTENGLLIPKDLLTGITEVDIRKQNGVIVVIPAGEDGPIDGTGREQVSQSDAKHSQFASAQGLIKISDDFDEPISADDPIFNIGRNPVSCGISDASENLDKYLYGGE